MNGWKRVPWPLWVYAGSNVLAAILIEVKAHGPVAAKLLFPIVLLTWIYFLLRGVRWIWIIAIVIAVLGFVPDLILGSLTLLGAAAGLIGLTLLLLPSTRRHFDEQSVAMDAR